jgi:MFS transporter, OPA family, sugar phosphate sensor protein UhpC
MAWLVYFHSIDRILGWISYIGAAVAGLPLSLLIRSYGWNAYFASMVGSGLAAIIILLPMFSMRGRQAD